MKKVVLLGWLVGFVLVVVGVGVVGVAGARGERAMLWVGPVGATATPCVGQYSCSVTPGATIVAGTVDAGNHCDDCVTNVGLPFAFTLYGTAYTSVNVSSNGNAQFVSTNLEFANVCLPVEAMGPTIFAYWEDLVTEGTNCTGGCGVYTSVSGSAPNRIFNIEWRAFYFSNPGNAYFEIRLYEAVDGFDIVIGAINTGGTATIGVQNGAGGFTQCVCGNTATANSRIVLTRSVCGSPTATLTPGGAATNTPTSVPSNTLTPQATGTGTQTVVPTNTTAATSTSTSIVSATSTPCDPIPIVMDAFSTCGSPDFYGYNFDLVLKSCGPADGDGTVQLMIAPDMAGPWTTIRTNVFSGTYQLDDNIISGRFNQTIVPAEYHYQRVYVSGEIGPNRTGFGGWGNPAITCPPCATTFSDVHFSDYFYTAVTYLACQNVITGYADGTFRPFNNTTRGQLSKIVVLAMGWTQECSTQHFSDVPPSDPFYCYVETAYGHEIISGYADGTFRPGNNVTRGQLSKIVVLAMGWTQTCNTQHFSDVPPGDPFFCYVETALAHGVVAGYADGTFRPGNSATRGQISVIVYRALGNS